MKCLSVQRNNIGPLFLGLLLLNPFLQAVKGSSEMGDDASDDLQGDSLVSVTGHRDDCSAPSKGLGCNPSGKYCTGLYEELVLWERHYASGEVRILPTNGVKTIIQSTGYCALLNDAYIVVPSDFTEGKWLLDRMLVASVVGRQFRLEWAPDSVGACQLNGLILYP